MKSAWLRHPELENPALLHQNRLPSRTEWFAYADLASPFWTDDWNSA